MEDFDLDDSTGTEEELESLLSFKVRDLSRKTAKLSTFSTWSTTDRLSQKDCVIEFPSSSSITSNSTIKIKQLNRQTVLKVILKKNSAPVNIKPSKLSRFSSLSSSKNRSATLFTKDSKKISPQSQGKFIKKTTNNQRRRQMIFQPKNLCNLQFDGEGILMLPDNKFIQGVWMEGVPVGEVKIRYSNMSLYEGQQYNSRPHGIGRVVLPSKKRYVGEFCYGNPHGEGILYSPEGNILKEGLWHHGKFKE